MTEHYFNVRNTARLHVIALLDPKVRAERIFTFAREHNLTDIINILHNLRPDSKPIPNPPEEEGRDLSKMIPIARAEQLLKSFFGVAGWVDLETSIAEGIVDMR